MSEKVHTENAMVELYDSVDADNNGQVSVHELKRLITEQLCPQITDDQVAIIFRDIDEDNDKIITKDEFIEQMCNKISPRVAVTNLFRKLDTDNSGFLTADELRPLLLEGGLGDDGIEEMLEKCDKNSDGKICCNELLALM